MFSMSIQAGSPSQHKKILWNNAMVVVIPASSRATGRPHPPRAMRSRRLWFISVY
jgi:hypothetical protein